MIPSLPLSYISHPRWATRASWASPGVFQSDATATGHCSCASLIVDYRLASSATRL